ncbi:hypothetical protein As57867_005158, partial [Aphanomyces stellatus]
MDESTAAAPHLDKRASGDPAMDLASMDQAPSDNVLPTGQVEEQPPLRGDPGTLLSVAVRPVLKPSASKTKIAADPRHGSTAKSVPNMIRRGTRKLFGSISQNVQQQSLGPNVMLRAPTILRFKKKLEERAQEAERRRLEAMSYATRHQHVLETYHIRATDTYTKVQVREKTEWLMLYPTAAIYKVWQLTLLGLIYYQVLSVPYSLAFETNDTDPRNDYMNILTSILFCVDVFLNFNTAMTNPKIPESFITDRYVIARRYVTSWFFLDLFSSIPFDLLTFWITSANSGRQQLHFLAVLKVARLPRLLKISRLSRILELLRVPTEWKRWFLYSRYAHLFRLGMLVLGFGVIVHMFACIWFGLVAEENWNMVIFNADFSVISPYMLSYYVSMQTVVGNNQLFQSDSEYTFTSCVIIFGAVVMAVVFGNVAILIENFYADQNSYKGKMESLFAVMNLLRLPSDLQLRIHEYYQVMYERHGTLDGQPELFKKELSHNLRIEVELFLRMTMIVRTPLFRECSNEVVQELVMQLRFQVYLPNDYVIVRGEVGHD